MSIIKAKTFDLNQILKDDKNTKYTIVNPDYRNLLIFYEKKDPNIIYGFNFGTMFFYELLEVNLASYTEDNIISYAKCYKVRQTLNNHIPNNFKVFDFHLQYRENRSPQIVEVRKIINFSCT